MDSLIRFVTRQNKTAMTDFALLSAIFCFAFFQNLGRLPLLGTDEARYMEIPREMLERGDFITPTLNYVPYFEKPPLHYWLNALSTLVFGETAFAARFFGALWGVLGVLLVYHVGREIFGRREGITSAIVLGTAIGYVVQGRVNITDTTLTFFLCASLGSFLLASMPDCSRKSLYYHFFYFFAALAVLAKGLIGVLLPALVIGAFIATTRRWELIREMHLKTGLLLFFLVCAPWFVLVSLDNPDFLRFFFIHEHFDRYLTKGHGRYQPPWFYIPVLFGCMLPWSFLIPKAVKEAWQNRNDGREEEKLFLLLWAGLIFVFFSLSGSKLIPYILPVYSPLALLVGSCCSRILEKSDGYQGWVRPLAFVHLILGAGVAAYPFLAKAPRITASGALILGIMFGAQGVAAFLNARAGQPKRLLYWLALISFIIGVEGPPVIYDGIARRKLTKDLAMMVKEKAGKDAVVASYGYQQELPLYTKRRVVVVGDVGELEFGSKQGNNRSWFLDPVQFQSLWSTTPHQVFALVPKDSLQPLGRVLVPAPEVLGMQGRQALITNKRESAVQEIGNAISKR